MKSSAANVKAGIVKAAAKLNTFAILSAKDITPDIKGDIQNIIPVLSYKDIDANQDLIRSVKVVAFEYDRGDREVPPGNYRKDKETGRHSDHRPCTRDTIRGKYGP